MRNLQTVARAEVVAQQVALSPLFVAFQWDALVAVLTELVPIIVSCFRKDDGGEPSGEKAQAFVAARWNERRQGNGSGGYNWLLVRRLAIQARRAARRTGQRLSDEQGRALAVAALDNVRTGDPDQVSLIFREVEFLDNIVPEDSED